MLAHPEVAFRSLDLRRRRIVISADRDGPLLPRIGGELVALDADEAGQARDPRTAPAGDGGPGRPPALAELGRIGSAITPPMRKTTT